MYSCYGFEISNLWKLYAARTQVLSDAAFLVSSRNTSGNSMLLPGGLRDQEYCLTTEKTIA